MKPLPDQDPKIREMAIWILVGLAFIVLSILIIVGISDSNYHHKN